MPNIPRHSATITPQPVGKAPLPVSDVGAGAIGQGLQQVGKGISDIGNVLQRIRREQLALSDSINETKANAYIKSEKESFNAYLNETDLIIGKDGSNYESENVESFERLRNNISSLSFTNKTRKLMEAKLEALVEIRAAELRSHQSNVLASQAKSFLPLNIKNAIESGDELLIADAIGIFNRNKKRVWGSDQAAAEKILKDTIRDGKKAFFINQSKISPDIIIQEMEKKKKALGKTGRDKDGLNAKDYDDITASAYASKALAKQSLDTQQEADRDEISKAIRSGSPDIINIIELSKLDEKEQFIWSERAKTAAKRKAEGADIVTNQTVKGNLESMAYNIHNGSVSMPEFLERLEEERYDNETIDDTAYDSLRSLATGKFKSYQSNEIGSRITFARNQLVTLPDEIAWEEFLRKLTSKFQKEQAISLRKLELDNLDMYRKALSDWFKDHPDATADEIYATGRSMLALYRKTPEELREEHPLKLKGILGTIEGDLELRLKREGRLFDSLTKPKSIEEFEAMIKRIPDKKGRQAYYNKWADEVYK